MDLKLGFFKPKTIFRLKCKKLKLNCPSEKLWNHRDLHDKSHETLNPYFSFFLLPQSPSLQTATVQANLIGQPLSTSSLPLSICRKQTNPARAACWNAHCCYARRWPGWPRALLAAHTASMRLQRVPLVGCSECAGRRSMSKFPASVALICHPYLIYKFPRPILAYKNSITVK